MAKILGLARSGFGKSTGIIGLPDLGIEGLDPATTYLFSAVNKPLPRKGSKNIYKIVPTEGMTAKNVADYLPRGNRLISNDAAIIAGGMKSLIDNFGKHPYKTIVIDDLNYVQQDYYMKNALKGGWDTPKQIGYNMHLIFNEIDRVPEEGGMNIIVLAHYDAYRDKDEGTMIYKYKSTGNMVDEYITPEGKFETVLFGKKEWNEKEKKSYRWFVTGDDGTYPAKSPHGMFDSLYIINDLGAIIKKAEEFYE
jgi:hypothetical protein